MRVALWWQMWLALIFAILIGGIVLAMKPWAPLPPPAGLLDGPPALTAVA